MFYISFACGSIGGIKSWVKMREYHLRGMNPAEVRIQEQFEGEVLITL